VHPKWHPQRRWLDVESAAAVCHKRPFAHIWPPNGQTAEDRAKPSPPSRSPLNLCPEKSSYDPTGFLDAPASATKSCLGCLVCGGCVGCAMQILLLLGDLQSKSVSFRWQPIQNLLAAAEVGGRHHHTHNRAATGAKDEGGNSLLQAARLSPASARSQTAI
jgi:hypothetical protein